LKEAYLVPYLEYSVRGLQSIHKGAVFDSWHSSIRFPILAQPLIRFPILAITAYSVPHSRNNAVFGSMERIRWWWTTDMSPITHICYIFDA
ncbi:hypothetical protein VIGAN_06069400, partial [Vigna angularis var. angularis]